MAKTEVQWDTSENAEKWVVCFWILYWEYMCICPQQWTHLQQGSPTPQNSRNTPQRVTTEHRDCRSHLTLSKQCCTHRFTCKFQWHSSALMLVTSTASFPPVQTSSFFNCRYRVPLLCALCWLFLDLLSLPVLSPCAILSTCSNKVTAAPRQTAAARLDLFAHPSVWHPNLHILQAPQTEHVYSGIMMLSPSSPSKSVLPPAL